MKEAELALRHITIFHQMQSMIYALYYQLWIAWSNKPLGKKASWQQI
jgi:hypothetical protein